MLQWLIMCFVLWPHTSSAMSERIEDSALLSLLAVVIPMTTYLIARYFQFNQLMQMVLLVYREHGSLGHTQWNVWPGIKPSENIVAAAYVKNLQLLLLWVVWERSQICVQSASLSRYLSGFALKVDSLSEIKNEFKSNADANCVKKWMVTTTKK